MFSPPTWSDEKGEVANLAHPNQPLQGGLLNLLPPVICRGNLNAMTSETSR